MMSKDATISSTTRDYTYTEILTSNQLMERIRSTYENPDTIDYVNVYFFGDLTQVKTDKYDKVSTFLPVLIIVRLKDSSQKKFPVDDLAVKFRNSKQRGSYNTVCILRIHNQLKTFNDIQYYPSEVSPVTLSIETKLRNTYKDMPMFSYKLKQKPKEETVEYPDDDIE